MNISGSPAYSLNIAASSLVNRAIPATGILQIAVYTGWRRNEFQMGKDSKIIAGCHAGR